MGVKLKWVLFLHRGYLVKIGTTTRLLGGTTILVASLAVGAFIPSAVCTGISLLFLNCNTPSGPHVIPN